MQSYIAWIFERREWTKETIESWNKLEGRRIGFYAPNDELILHSHSFAHTLLEQEPHPTDFFPLAQGAKHLDTPISYHLEDDDNMTRMVDFLQVGHPNPPQTLKTTILDRSGSPSRRDRIHGPSILERYVTEQGSQRD